MMPTLRVCLFGPLTVEMDGRRIEIKQRKALALLVYLACTNRVQRRDTLATLLWPEFGQSDARAALRRRLSELGHALGVTWLETDRETVGLASSPERWVDVVDFQAHLAACDGHGHEATEVCEACRVSLYRDSFLADFSLQNCLDFDDWQLIQREALRIAFADTLQRLLYVSDSGPWHLDMGVGPTLRRGHSDHPHLPIGGLVFVHEQIVGEKNDRTRITWIFSDCRRQIRKYPCLSAKIRSIRVPFSITPTAC